jgi:hypothetical protein
MRIFNLFAGNGCAIFFVVDEVAVSRRPGNGSFLVRVGGRRPVSALDVPHHALAGLAEPV